MLRRIVAWRPGVEGGRRPAGPGPLRRRRAARRRQAGQRQSRVHSPAGAQGQRHIVESAACCAWGAVAPERSERGRSVGCLQECGLHMAHDLYRAGAGRRLRGVVAAHGGEREADQDHEGLVALVVEPWHGLEVPAAAGLLRRLKA